MINITYNTKAEICHSLTKDNSRKAWSVRKLTPKPVPPMAVQIPVHPKANSSAMRHSSNTPKPPTPPEISWNLRQHSNTFFFLLHIINQTCMRWSCCMLSLIKLKWQLLKKVKARPGLMLTPTSVIYSAAIMPEQPNDNSSHTRAASNTPRPRPPVKSS